jgi:hypothetical protein
MRVKDEYRLFVYQQKLVAISQQNIYAVFDPDLEIDQKNTYIHTAAQALTQYFYEHILPKVTWTQSYTIDMAMIGDIPYFIELNSFGKQYAAGSALFHWDESLLYRDNRDNQDNPQPITVRYTWF